jgi:hypothetical protein
MAKYQSAATTASQPEPSTLDDAFMLPIPRRALTASPWRGPVCIACWILLNRRWPFAVAAEEEVVVSDVVDPSDPVAAVAIR